MVDRLNIPDELNSLIEKREEDRRKQSEESQAVSPDEDRRSGEDRRSPSEEQTPSDD